MAGFLFVKAYIFGIKYFNCIFQPNQCKVLTCEYLENIQTVKSETREIIPLEGTPCGYNSVSFPYNSNLIL